MFRRDRSCSCVLAPVGLWFGARVRGLPCSCEVLSGCGLFFCWLHVRTAYYHPRVYGGVERFHQSLKNGLTHLAQGCSFTQAIRYTLHHYRATQHSTTGVSLSLSNAGPGAQPAARQAPPLYIPGSSSRVRVSVIRQQRRMKQQFDQSK